MTIIEAVIGALILSVVIGLLLAWPVMVLLGVFASMTGFSGFAIGFWPTLVAIITVRLAVGGASSSN